MENIRRIVVGYDASAEAEIALDWAIARAQQTSSRLTIVRAVQSDLVIGALRVRADESATEAARSRDFPGVKKAQQTLGEGAVEVVTSVGNPAAALVETSHEADLVVVGTRGHGALMSGLVGSTSYAVAGHCVCPVVIVRGPKKSPAVPLPTPDAPVVMGVEEVETSAPALDVACAYAKDYGAPLRLVRASYYVPVAAVTAEAALASNELIEALDAADEDILESCAAYVRQHHPEVTVETRHEKGDPAHALTAASQDAGLLVVGSRGHGGFTGLLLGSVSHAVIHQACCPVAVVR